MAGGEPADPAPAQPLAQNDATLGEIHRVLSHRLIWKDTLVPVVEDVAQKGTGHVDATRAEVLSTGPSVLRGASVGDRYNQLSLLLTIGLILGFQTWVRVMG
ncbi:MAG: hypothetical protein WBM08_12145 [Prochlorococcaceae cyanobacterium]